MADALDCLACAENFHTSYMALMEADTLSKTIMHLEAFQSATEQFGIHASLLAFADHDQTLSTAIPEIPSLETYLTDARIDMIVANEGLIDTIKQTTRRFLDAFMEHIVKYSKWYSQAIGVLLTIGLLMTGGYTKIFTYGAKIAANSYLTNYYLVDLAKTVAAPMVGAVLLGNLLSIARSTPLAVRESLALNLPTDVDGRASYVRKVTAIFMQRAKIDLDKLGVTTLNASERGKSARELGYTIENIDAVVKETSAAIEELKRCEFVPKRLEELAHSVEATTSNGRAALMFITSVINKTMHLAVTDVMKSSATLHQLVTPHEAKKD